MERLVERLEKAVERLETVCRGPGMCGDGSSKGKAQSTSPAASSHRTTCVVPGGAAVWPGGAAVSDISSSWCRAGSARAGCAKGC